MKPMYEERQDVIRDLDIRVGSRVSFITSPGQPSAEGEVVSIDEDDFELSVTDQESPICPLRVQKVLPKDQ